MSPKKKKIAVLFGGKSPEHDVSILTGLQVLSAVDPDLYESSPVYISAAGRWLIGETLRQRSSYIPSQSEIQSLTAVSLQIGMSNGPCLVSEQKSMFRGTQRIEFDFAIPALHGLYGEDGRIQGPLESAGVPYSGMRPLASSTFMDKIATKRMLAATGIPQLPYWRIDRPQQGLLVTVDELARIVPDAKFPCCVKPARLGSSIGVARVEDYQELSDVLPNFFRYDSTAILEPFVTDLGSGLIDHSQNRTAAAMQMAEK